MKTPITEKEEFKTQLAANKKGLFPYDADIYNEAYISGAAFTQHLMQKEHYKEMIEFDMWKTELFAEDDLACFNCGKWLKWNDDKNCWIEYTPEELFELFIKERGNETV